MAFLIIIDGYSADKGFEGFVSVTESRLVVRHDGHVSWSLPLIVKSSCAVDVAYFPFDSQVRSILPY